MLLILFFVLFLSPPLPLFILSAGGFGAFVISSLYPFPFVSNSSPPVMIPLLPDTPAQLA